MSLQPGDNLSHYRLIEILGEGGMGQVWRAEDTKLVRPVALKVLPPDSVGNEESRLRFLREARTAAAVIHPNIAAIHEIDDADGVIFIAMELVEGTTLRSTLAAGRLPLRDGLRIASEIGEALAAAHESRVIHRDLKPENVMIRPDGHVKVLDFGLAKIHGEAGGDTKPSDSATRLQTISAEMTKEGRILGTAAYMSPEQARGLKVDARSDLFSVGIVLYEMVTGSSPFRGPTVTDTLSSIVRDHPEDPSKKDPEVPGELGRIVSKCLEKDPADRYQHTDDLVVDLRALRRLTESHPIPKTRERPRAAWARPLPLALAALMVVALLVAGWQWLLTPGTTTPGEKAALAVMPFDNLKDAGDPERLGQILQELVITDLSGLDALTVFSSQRLFDIHKQISGDARRTIDPSRATEVAARVGASTILTGSLSRLGDRWILTGQLVKTGSGEVTKSERIDGDDLYRMVDDLTSRIRADLVAEAAATADNLAVEERTTTSLAAYQKYLEGEEALSRDYLERAVERYREALELDPTFGQAQMKLAIAEWWRVDTSGESLFRELVEGNFKLSERDHRLAEGLYAVAQSRYGEARSILLELVADHPDEKTAWYALGESHYHHSEGDLHSAADAFERALMLDPSFVTAYRHLEDMYAQQGRYEQAIRQVQGFLRLDAENPTWYAALTKLLLLNGDVEEAEAALAEAAGRFAGHPLRWEVLAGGGWAFADAGHYQRAKVLFEEALVTSPPEDRGDVLGGLGIAHYEDGEWERAEQIFRRALDEAPGHFDTRRSLPRLLLRQRRYEEAITVLREALRDNPDDVWLTVRLYGFALAQGNDEEAARILAAERNRSSGTNRLSSLLTMVAVYHLDNLGHISAGLAFAKEAVEETSSLRNKWQLETLGWAHWEMGQFAEAARRYREALKVRRGNMQDWSVQGLVSTGIARGAPEEVIDDARRLLENYPMWPESYRLMHELHISAGREAEARTVIETGLTKLHLDKDRRELLANAAAWTLTEWGRPAEAEDYARRALALEGGTRDEEVWYALASALAVQGRFDEAEDAYEQMQALNPGRLWAELELARVDLLRGDAAGAENRLRAILADGPPHRQVFELLAIALAEQGRFGDAEPHARTVVKLSPDRAAHALLSWILVAGDLDLKEGTRLAEASMSQPAHVTYPIRLGQYPYLPCLEHALGLAYKKLGRDAEAAPLLEKAAVLQPTKNRPEDL